MIVDNNQVLAGAFELLQSCDAFITRVSYDATPEQVRRVIYSGTGAAAPFMIRFIPSAGRFIKDKLGYALQNLEEMSTRRKYLHQLRAEFGDLLDEASPECLDMPEKVSATTFIPFNGKEQLATYDPSRGGFIVHDEVDAFVAKKLHTCDTDLKSQFTWVYEKICRYDATWQETEAPIVDSSPPTVMPDESDSYCAITAMNGGNGPFMAAWRDQDWLITARHGILPGRALQNYATALYVKKGDGVPIRIRVSQSEIVTESLAISNLEVFGCSGHDLIAFRIVNADQIFSQLQIKSQKLFYPLAKGTMFLKGHFGPDSKCHISQGTLMEIPEDKITGTIHHTAYSCPGMSGSPIFSRYKGRTVMVGMHLGTWGSDKGYANVAASYFAIQRLRKQIGTATSLSHKNAYVMLSNISRPIHVESPTTSDTQSTIDDDEFNKENALVAAKKGSKAYNRALRGNVAGENAQRDGVEGRRQAAESHAENYGQGSATSNRDRQYDQQTIGQRSQQSGQVRRRWADMDDDDNEAPKANKIADEWLVIDNDDSLDPEANHKARRILETLRRLNVENPGWAYDYQIIASYSGVGLNSIRKSIQYLVANQLVFQESNSEDVETSPGIVVKNTFQYFSAEKRFDRFISCMPESARWPSAMVHERTKKSASTAVSGLHIKGELKNQQAHLATLYKKIKELEEEIKSLEERIEAEPKSATQEKRDMEARQETRLDQDKLNALICSLLDLKEWHTGSPSWIGSHLRRTGVSTVAY